MRFIMTRIARFFSLALCFLVSLGALAQKEDWLPVTPQDLQYKEVPGNKGASAVRLYYAQYINDNNSSCFVYERIKILNEKALAGGNSYADVQIPILTFGGIVETITELKARTIKPDGSIVEFTGKPFEKVVFKGRGDKISVEAFSMPAVEVGSIIEYKYRAIVSTPGLAFVKVFARDSWDIQREIFTVKESLYYQPFGGTAFQSNARPQFYFDGARVSRVTMNLKEKPKETGNDVSLELTNVPAFDREDYMPPEDIYKPSVIFFYGRKGNPSVDKEWEDIGKDRYEELETFLAANRGVKEAAQSAIGEETEPGMKLRKLYERAQAIRNLTFERERTKEERKAENIQKNNGVGDVLAHGYGYEDGITYLFVAMARAAGFDASIVQVSDRKRRFFVKNWTSLRQLDSEIAVVNLNGSDIYLEPGTRFCPYGTVRWNHTVTEGLKLGKKGGTFVKAPPLTYDKSVTRRTATMSLDEDGTLKGDVVLEFEGTEALEHRLDAIDSDEAGRKKNLEDELKEWLPTGAIVKMAVAQGWETTGGPLVARFNIEVPGYATLAGKRLLIPAFLFQSKENQTFAHSQRKYPLYFPYPFTDTDTVTIKVPSGFTPESIPAAQDAKLGYARYQNMSQFDGIQLVSQRQLAFNGIYFDLDKYSELKSFFSKVQAGDEQQAVLHGGNVSAQKGN
jgi:hypothetical protein